MGQNTTTSQPTASGSLFGVPFTESLLGDHRFDGHFTPTRARGPLSASGTPTQQGMGSAFAPLSDVNALAPANQSGQGADPMTAWLGSLFGTSQPTGQQPLVNQTPPAHPGIQNPAFQTDMLMQMLGLNVPTALGSYGTQASLFGDMVGLGNPMLLPLLLLMANRPTTSVPFDPVVQSGSPVDLWGLMGLNGAPFFPPPGTTIPPNIGPPFKQPPPLPGPPDAIPGPLPPVGHGPFKPGQHGVGGGGGGGGDGGAGSGGGGDQLSWGYTTGASEGGKVKSPGKNASQRDKIAAIARVAERRGQGEEYRDEAGNIIFSTGDR